MKPVAEKESCRWSLVDATRYRCKDTESLLSWSISGSIGEILHKS
jgi:hypothetical protein